MNIPANQLWCLNWRHNGMWSVLSDYRDLSEAVALAISTYINWGGRIRTEECTPDTLVIETPRVMGALDVLYLKGDPEMIARVRLVIKCCEPDGWKSYFEQTMGFSAKSTGLDTYQCLWAMVDYLRSLDFTPQECVYMIPPERRNKCGPYAEKLPPPCYGGRLPA